jgi:hypothetical protein
MRYEYLKEVPTGAQVSVERLAELGNEGWELKTSNRDVFYFQREVDEKKRIETALDNISKRAEERKKIKPKK